MAFTRRWMRIARVRKASSIFLPKPKLKRFWAMMPTLFSIYYHVTEDGNWEEEHSNVFFRKEGDAELAEKLGLTG
jgi:UDP:flavonoid glycosyltransferase YjiC (YdhE family)